MHHRHPALILGISLCTALGACADIGLGGWQETTPLPEGRFFHSALVHGDRLYVVGGVVAFGDPLDEVLSAPIEDDGLLGEWEVAATLPFHLEQHGSFVYDGNLYVVHTALGPASNASVHWAPLQPDGTLGDWLGSIEEPAFGAYHGIAVAHREGRMYALGGGIGTDSIHADFWHAAIDEDGIPCEWEEGPDLDPARYAAEAFVRDDVLYVLGGAPTYDPEFLDAVEMTALVAGGEPIEWTATEPLWHGASGHVAIPAGDELYLLDGRAVGRASFAGDGGLSGWDVANTSYPVDASDAAGVAHDGRIYITGGADDEVPTDAVYVAEIE